VELALVELPGDHEFHKMGFSGCLYLRVELFDRLMIDLFSAAKRRRNVLRLAMVYIDSA
jgi:hypothetical protein